MILASWFRRENAIGPRRFVEACVETCHAMVPLTAAVAAGGIIIGAIELTGLAGKFTLLLFQLSGGLMLPSLLLAGVVLILLGTGMPTTATYIMGVALLAPVFIGKFGLPVIEVHMFMLFYASLSAISPPVAVAAFAAAAIAKANPFKLMPYACKLAVGGFVLPFFFVFNPGILMQGGVLAILSDSAVGCGAGGHRIARPARLCPKASDLTADARRVRAGCARHGGAAAGDPIFGRGGRIGLYLLLLRETQSDPAWSR